MRYNARMLSPNFAAMKTITVSAIVNAPREKVWEFWNAPEHITQWAFASDDWHAPYSENDLRENGKFKTTMAAKDGSMSFDFEGVYEEVITPARIVYSMADDRRVEIDFEEVDGGTQVTETFDAEGTHSEEQQREGWQSILNNFKKHVEDNA
jgi:uncharacterized protein YndB with AHSA1/START domain